MLLSISGIEPGNWAILSDEETVSEGASVAVPLARFEEEGESFFEKAGSVGAIVSTETAYADLAALVNRLAFVAIDFPAFGDGRGFSLAVRLRKDLGFKGEIRAIGKTIPDQAQFLMRSGFDSVDVPEERKEAYERAVNRFKDFYQTDFLGTESVPHVRHSPVDERKAS